MQSRDCPIANIATEPITNSITLKWSSQVLFGAVVVSVDNWILSVLPNF